MLRLMYICYFFMIKKNQRFKIIPISVVPGMHDNEIFCPEVSNTGVIEKFAVVNTGKIRLKTIQF